MFSGSGTTLVQANELGMHAIGVDISAFNAMISNVKIERHNIPEIMESILDKWFLFPVREEINFLLNEMKKVDNEDVKKILAI